MGGGWTTAVKKTPKKRRRSDLDTSDAESPMLDATATSGRRSVQTPRKKRGRSAGFLSYAEQSDDDAPVAAREIANEDAPEPIGRGRRSRSRTAQPPPAMVKVKEEVVEISDDEENADPRAKRARSKPRVNKEPTVAQMKVKMEPEDDPMAQLSLVRPSRFLPGPLDGAVKGSRLNAYDRAKIERKSCVIYPYPRFASFGEGRRTNTGRTLDLMLDDEVDGNDYDKSKEYSINGILALNKDSALVEWSGYKYAMWHPKWVIGSGSALKDYNRRMKYLDPIMKDICKTETLSSLRMNYPNMMLNQTVDYEEYVQHPGILYKHGLSKRERQINDQLDEIHGRSGDETGAMLIFEDWTDHKNSSIPTFEYIFDNVMTKSAAEIMGKLKSNKTSCACVKSASQGMCCVGAKCGKKNNAVAYQGKNQLCTTFKGSPGRNDFQNSDNDIDVYECDDGCGCDPANCMQRAVQLGHRNVLVVFMHHEKGWTLRAGHDIKRGVLVCEYTGLLCTLAEASNFIDQTYQMAVTVKTKNGEEHAMVLDARLKGNEGRYLAHSCDPNVFSAKAHFDINGRTPRHIGLYATRDIHAGEELTIDYMVTVTNPAEFTRRAGFICRCGAANCRGKRYRAMQRRRSSVARD